MTAPMPLASRGPAPVLRPYQEECLAAILAFEARGGRRGLVAMATGLGKTTIFARLPERFGRRMLVLAHREELLDQAAGQLQVANPGLSITIEQADRHADPGADVVIASVQTLYGSRHRLDALAAGQPFGLIVLDEAHHAVAISYLTIMEAFGLAPGVQDLNDADLTRREVRVETRRRFEAFRPAPSVPLLTGWTATPTRSDGRGLEFIFDDIVYSKSSLEGMEEGWLSGVRGLRVQTGTDITGVRTQRGDFAEHDLSRAVDTPARNALAVRAFLDHAVPDRRPTLVYGVTVEHAQHLQAAFLDHDVRAGLVVGTTPTEERRRLLEAFRRGDIPVVVNVMVLTEGFDAPGTACIIMARPTRSATLYTQVMGRGMRVAEGKRDLLVLDLADAAKPGVVMLPSLFGLPPKIDLSVRDVLTTRRAFDELESQVPLDRLGDVTSIEGVRTLAEVFDPMRAAIPEPWLRTTLLWIKTAFGYAVGLPGAGQIGVVVDILGHGDVRYRAPGERSVRLGRYAGIQDAIDAAEAWAISQHGRSAAAMSANARWRRDAPTSKQLWRARKEGIRLLDEEAALLRAYQSGDEAAVARVSGQYRGRTKGEISMLLDRAIASGAFGP